ncbi:MAG: saccharopine dehydrogenase NADP-binding domain-containing protein, partial [Bacteroidota bacterium]
MSFFLYGATGYTGRLIADLAVSRGVQPLLGGRDPARLGALADALALDHVAVGLDQPAALDRVLNDVPLVLHAAGPFSHTSRPMIDACLRTGTHYLDITGEIAVFEALAARSREATEAGIVVLPGVGFDVVPTDCLAMHLHRRLPTATHLRLAFRALGGVSHGTARTAMEHAGRGGAARIAGEIVSVPAAHDQIRVDVGDGRERVCTAIPWGDVSTAYHSTGIPNVTTYTAMPPRAVGAMRASNRLSGLLQTRPAQAFLRAMVDRRVTGPTEAERQRGRSFVWGEATDASGGRVVSRWAGPEGYTVTADAALRAALAVLEGRTEPGFQTPS